MSDVPQIIALNFQLTSSPKPPTPRCRLSRKEDHRYAHSCTCTSKYDESSLVSVHAVVHQHCQAQLFSPANAMIILKKPLFFWLEKIRGMCLFFSPNFLYPKEQLVLHFCIYYRYYAFSLRNVRHIRKFILASSNRLQF